VLAVPLKRWNPLQSGCSLPRLSIFTFHRSEPLQRQDCSWGACQTRCFTGGSTRSMRQGISLRAFFCRGPTLRGKHMFVTGTTTTSERDIHSWTRCFLRLWYHVWDNLIGNVSRAAFEVELPEELERCWLIRRGHVDMPVMHTGL